MGSDRPFLSGILGYFGRVEENVQIENVTHDEVCEGFQDCMYQSLDQVNAIGKKFGFIEVLNELSTDPVLMYVFIWIEILTFCILSRHGFIQGFKR